jgi:hypothetical protein
MSIMSRLRHNIAFATIAEGDVRGTEKRRCERLFIDQLTASGIALEQVDLNGNACTFVFDARKSTRFAQVVQALNLAVHVRRQCACLTVSRTPTDVPLPSLARVIEVLDEEAIDVLHLTADGSALRLVVDESDAEHLATIVPRFYTARLAQLSA